MFPLAFKAFLNSDIFLFAKNPPKNLKMAVLAFVLISEKIALTIAKGPHFRGAT